MQMVDKRFEIIPQDVSVHRFVIDYFLGKKGSTRTDTRKKIARDLNRMRVERNIADYEKVAGSLHHLKTKAEEVRSTAKRVTDALKTRGL